MNQSDDEEATSLHYAINFNNEAVSNEACVLLLLANEANTEAHEFVFGTVLSRAVWFENEQIVRLLMRQGANVHARGGF